MITMTLKDLLKEPICLEIVFVRIQCGDGMPDR